MDSVWLSKIFREDMTVCKLDRPAFRTCENLCRLSVTTGCTCSMHCSLLTGLGPKREPRFNLKGLPKNIEEIAIISFEDAFYFNCHNIVWTKPKVEIAVVSGVKWQNEEKFGKPQDGRGLLCFYQLTNSISSEQIGKGPMWLGVSRGLGSGEKRRPFPSQITRWRSSWSGPAAD